MRCRCFVFWLGVGVAVAQRRAMDYFEDLLPTQADIDAEVARGARALRGEDR